MDSVLEIIPDNRSSLKRGSIGVIKMLTKFTLTGETSKGSYKYSKHQIAHELSIQCSYCEVYKQRYIFIHKLCYFNSHDPWLFEPRKQRHNLTLL
jgi:hypothetical protein